MQKFLFDLKFFEEKKIRTKIGVRVLNIEPEKCKM